MFDQKNVLPIWMLSTEQNQTNWAPKICHVLSEGFLYMD